MSNFDMTVFAYVILSLSAVIFTFLLPFFRPIGKVMVLQYYGFLAILMLLFLGIYFSHYPLLNIKVVKELIAYLFIGWGIYLILIALAPIFNVLLNLMTGHQDLNKGKEKEFYLGLFKFGFAPALSCLTIAVLLGA